MTTELSPLEFKSATLYAIRVVLQHADNKELIKALKKRMADAGAFYENEPVVIDATRLDEAIDWAPLLDAFKKHKLPVIGVVAQGENLALAQAFGLTSVDLSAAPARHASDTQTAASVAEPVTASLPTPEASEDTIEVAPSATQAIPNSTATTKNSASPSAPASSAAPTMVIKGPLRSGQRVYARNSDLIVLGVVSRGAEVIADGNIHVYGALRGRAIAGGASNMEARVFALNFDPELVSIAGFYAVREGFSAAQIGKAMQVRLVGERMRFDPIT